MNFHQLINQLSKEQRVYKFPYQISKPQDNVQTLEYVLQQMGYKDQKTEFELIPSHKREDSILISIINALFQYPSHQIDQYLSQLKDYLTHWMIVYRDIMKDYKLNPSKINYYLTSGLDHEDEILLLALIFKINIIVINLNQQFQLYSPINVDNVYVVLFQHNNLKYSAVKFKPHDKKALSNLTGFMSIIEPDHPFIKTLMDNIAESQGQ